MDLSALGDFMRPARPLDREIPALRRARGWRLSTASGKRLLDMRAVSAFAGAKGPGRGSTSLSTALKGLLDRGLLGDYAGPFEARLAKAIESGFAPGFRVAGLFRSGVEAAIEAAGMGMAGHPVDGVLRREGSEGLAIVRAFGPGGYRGEEAGSPPLPPETRYAIAILPGPLAPVALLERGETISDGPMESARPEAGDRGPSLLPPIALLASERSLRDLYAATDYAEAYWAERSTRIGASFDRKGPWLYARCDEADYPRFWRAALAAGMLLSTDWAEPSAIPMDCDPAEVRAP